MFEKPLTIGVLVALGAAAILLVPPESGEADPGADLVVDALEVTDRFGRASESSAAGPWLAAAVAALALAVAGVSCSGSKEGGTDREDAGGTLPAAEKTRPSVAPSASALGREYRRAVARMTGTNHLLEQRQADLYFATRDGASAEVIADLRREVASLERQYADRIEAMNEALRCEASDCPGRG